MIELNPALLALTKDRLGIGSVIVKNAFIPAGDPSGGGGDPSQQGGAPPGGAPPGMPPGGDPSQGGAPPPGGAPPGMPPGGDPSQGGGAPPPPGGGGLDPVMQVLSRIEMALQQGGAGGAGAPKKTGSGGKGGDELARQMYNQNVLLTAIITAMNKGGMQVEIPANMLLGPAPGTDPAMAAQQGIGAGMGQPGVAAPGDPSAQGPGGAPPGQDPNAAQQGGDPSQQQPQQIQFAPNLAQKTAEDDFASEDELLALGIPYPRAKKEAAAPGAITELFGLAPGTPAPPGTTVSNRAGAVYEMIAATRRTRDQR